MKFIKTSLCAAILTAMMSTSSFADCSYELFSISSSKNTKIIDFIDQLSDECGFSVIVTDSEAEKFLETKLNKTNLKNLTIDEVLNIILTENNIGYTLENNLLKISYIKTKVFNIDYILSQRKSTASTDVTLSSGSDQSETSGSGSESTSSTSATSDSGIKIESTDEVKFWEQLDTEFQGVLNRPSDLYKAPEPIINKNAGLITVTATTKQLKRFSDYLKKLQSKVQLQVLIDVQLLVVTMSEGKSTGIDWKQLYALQNIKIGGNLINTKNVDTYTSDEVASDITEITKNGFYSAGILNIKGNATLNEVIKFLKTQGDVKSISNPKVLTLNNQPALITAGTEYFYKIKSSSTLAGGNTGTTTESDTVQSVFAGVLLTITPEISDDKTITLKINPSLSETRTGMTETNTGRDMPPDLNRRQLSSVVTVKDGNRVVLGGLINTKNSTDSNKVPILGDIPILNYLFKYEEKIKQTQELVMIIEPHIIHKEKNTVSLSDLGYTGLQNDLLELEQASKDNKIATKSKKEDKTDDKK